jgi:signal transduction histidine kinase/ActR/RegA family two-component response regulator
MSIGQIPWLRRLEARVVAGVIVLVALSLAAILAATTRLVTDRSLERTSADLEAARIAFHRLAADRAEFASAQSALVTALPVFRAHLTDTRLAQDAATVEALADHYRTQLKAAFAIVGDRDGNWLASSGWSSGKPPAVTAAVADATAGTPTRRFVVTADGLFLVVSEPAGFADEVLGTLTVGYALDDDLARSLAQVTHCDVNLVAGGRVFASSLPPDGRSALIAALAQPGWPGNPDALQTLGEGKYAYGSFPLALDGGRSDARLILLDDWGPTQAFLNQIRWRLLGTGAVIFVIAISMGVLFSRRMARPVEELAAAAKDIAGGNWTRQLPVNGTAEEAVMAEAVNSMTTSIRHWYEEAKVRDDQLRQAQKLEALGRLAGGVAHDFNNFLTAIKGYSELLMDTFDATDKRRTKVEGITKAADTAAGLTRQLLAFSRRRVVAVQVLSLERLLGGTQKMLRRLIGEDVELRTAVAPDTSCVRADPNQIEQVLLNLVVNARDAMPGGGRIDVELGDTVLAAGREADALKLQPGRYVRLTVRDTGCGMTAEVKARIFEPFFTTKQEGAGTGLGLAVVHGIVEQLGGAIAVETEVNRGTTFHIYVPHTAEREVHAVVAAPVARRTGTETILVVEDERQVSEMVTRALRKAGYTVLRASRGSEALEILRTHEDPIHMMLTDIVMPGMNGRELADRVKAMRPEIRILYMSGYSDDAVLRRGVESATAEFIPKPFSLTTLTARIRDILDPPAEQVA